ncbi:MAG TPA: hypothetical protein DEO71_00930 [Chryseobacterium sp.]|nr:hypothetical protein [Chryseobacterium sp.]
MIWLTVLVTNCKIMINNALFKNGIRYIVLIMVNRNLFKKISLLKLQILIFLTVSHSENGEKKLEKS